MKRLKLYAAFLIFLLVFFGLSFFVIQFKNDDSAKRFYAQGMEYFNNKNYQDAYYNFKQIHFFSSWYELSLIKQYQCAMNLSDKKTAHQKLVKLTRSLKDDKIRPWAMYFEANLAQELNLYSDKKILSKFKKINRMYPDSDFSYASAYKIAKMTNDTEKYVEYLKYAPVGKFAIPALESIDINELQSEEDKMVVADAMFLNSRYDEALKLYLQTSFEDSWFKIAKCYREKRNKEKEKETILQGLNTDGIDSKDIDSAIDRLSSYYGAKKTEILKTLYLKKPNAQLTYKLAEAIDPISASKLYNEVIEKYPDSIYASNSLWELFWYNYKNANDKECEKLYNQYIRNYQKTQDIPRISYWMAKIYLKQNKTKQANDIFKKIVNNYKLNYYAFLSAKQLDSSNDDFISKKPIEKHEFKPSDLKFFNDNKNLLYLANSNDIETLEEFKLQDSFVKSWIAYKKGNYPQAIMFAKDEYLNKDEANYSDKELYLLYPILFEEDINKYCLEYNQSPYLFLSLIKEESHFDKSAKSAAGASGLVQILPETAVFIEENPITRKYIHENNIKIGVKYFDYLTKMYEGNVYFAILAYNAGPGKIKQWMNNELYKHPDVDVFVENIPYYETRSYIKKILSSYWAYINIYSDKK